MLVLFDWHLFLALKVFIVRRVVESNHALGGVRVRFRTWTNIRVTSIDVYIFEFMVIVKYI